MSIALDHPHVSNDGPWTLGVKIGLPFAIVGALVLLGVVASLFAVAWHKRGVARDDVVDIVPWRPVVTYTLTAVVALLLALTYCAGVAAALYPFDSSYHQYRAVTGTVDRITSRLLTGANQKFVVTFKGSPQQYGVDDTRASLVKPGDTITISCIRSFQYGSTDGYDCNWGQP